MYLLFAHNFFFCISFVFGFLFAYDLFLPITCVCLLLNPCCLHLGHSNGSWTQVGLLLEVLSLLRLNTDTTCSFDILAFCILLAFAYQYLVFVYQMMFACYLFFTYQSNVSWTQVGLLALFRLSNEATCKDFWQGTDIYGIKQ